ncbi:PliI family lysozyme inhibitor of I-type lysozyme [Aeromonas veronii]|uniref:PliI family lysozyme inhibitor of I-type lysozyme n=1 Tax=Aeromonas TaxID=642 RepID=UPI0021E6F60E|nr:PliI family lysozyme inhibitor of I-type lysozyme [Aeromonas veronii]MCV3283941.1 PliI family lysozyme inhibitor of I-type lysozyme [Aeromonas veronii]
MNRALMMAGLLTLPLAAQAQAEEGFNKQLTLPSGQVIRVAQGVGEPASIGSYDVRLYSGQNAQFPLDEFQDGKVMARNGFIRELKLIDLNGDKQPELVVIIESAGSGSYQDADAYTVSPQGELEIFNQVKELEPKEDVVKALKSPQD